MDLSASGLTPAQTARTIWAVCYADVRAFKPGNVSLDSAGHGMTADDFIASADVIKTPLSVPDLSVGQRILRAVQATRARVGCNTNLGIILLLAPLACAAVAPVPSRSLQLRVQRVLASLTQGDAEDTFAAIRIANPGGLGEAAEHDVRQPARVTLLEAMQEAAPRDSVAREYANGFADIFRFGVTRIEEGLANWGDEDWAVLSCYLGLLARMPDTHIVRKLGLAAAEPVSRTAQRLDRILAGLKDPAELAPHLRAWDEDLKNKGLNPGTTADLTVASLAAAHLQRQLNETCTGAATSDSAAGYVGAAGF